MDLVQSIQQRLHNLRTERSEIEHNYDGLVPEDIANAIIADCMNMLETLYVVLNLPSDGFTSFSQGSQPNVESDGEEASSSRM